MRVIKKGTPQEIRVICSGRGNGKGGCGSTLGVTYDDIYHTQSHTRDDSTSYATILCPACNKLTDLFLCDIPDQWHNWKYKPAVSPDDIYLSKEKSTTEIKQTPIEREE